MTVIIFPKLRELYRLKFIKGILACFHCNMLLQNVILVSI